MTVPTIQEYLAGIEAGPPPIDAITLTTGAGTQAGWWLLAVHSMVTDRVGAVVPQLSQSQGWRLLGECSLGDVLNFRRIHRVWARQVTTGGANAVVFPALTGTTLADAHARLYVLSGVRSYDPFRFRPTKSGSLIPADQSTSHTCGQVYCPDSDGLEIRVWLCGGPVNYTLPAALTVQTELDGNNSTSRSGYRSIAASGPTGELTGTSSVAKLWTAVSILVSGSQGAIMFPTSPLGIRAELALGADLGDHPDDWAWTDITSYVLHRDRIEISYGRADESGEVDPAQCTLTLRNNNGAGGQVGIWSEGNPRSPHYGLLRRNTPIRVWVNPGGGFTDRFSGFVSAWPPRWDLSGRDQYVQLAAQGLLYRLGQGTPPALSAWRRTILSRADGGLLAYWPCEDAERATRVASALPGGSPMAVAGDVVFADLTIEALFSAFGTVRAGTEPLLDLSLGGQLIGVVPPGSSSPVAWAVSFLAGANADNANEDIVLARWSTPSGTFVKWEVKQVDATVLVEVAGYNAAGTRTVVMTSTGISDRDFYRVEAEQSGADTVIRFHVTTAQVDSDTLTTHTLARVNTFVANPDSNSVSIGGLHIGHIQVWDVATPSTIDYSETDEYAEPVYTYYGGVNEAAHLRLSRLCDEDQILLDMPAVESQYVIRMDSQPVGAQLDLYQACSDTDGGVLHESGFGLGYLPRASRYNPPVAIELDYDDANLCPAEPLVPVKDEQDLRNRVTITRDGGSAATYEDTASIEEVGLYPGSGLTLNIAAGENLTDRASMEVARLVAGSRDYRYPQISLNLSATPDVLPDWLSAGQGARLVIANPPDDLPPEDIDLIIEGYSETIGFYDWDVVANCSPSAPWNMWTVEGDDNTGRLESGGIEVVGAVTSSATLLPVRHTGRRRATTDAGDMPFDIEVTSPGYIAGERCTVTDVDDITVAFIAAGTAAHANNANVTPGLPAGRAAGDLLLTLAAIRNSGTGVPNQPAGFTTLLDMGNAKLFGRIATNTAADQPTISFTGGVAGADTSAQMACWRGAGLAVIASDAQLNSAAQNVAYPALVVPEDECIIIYLGWKQDDWTSVATIADATEIGEPNTTTGDDQGLVWDYVIQTTAVDISSGSLVVTGGASAISRGAVVAIPTARQQMTVTRSVNGATLAHSHEATVRLWRPSRLAM